MNPDRISEDSEQTVELAAWRELLARSQRDEIDVGLSDTGSGQFSSLRAELAEELSNEAIDDFTPSQRQLGDYLILQQIGRGGMGIVYEAEQLSFSRRVALKVLPEGEWVDPDKVTRFHTEARVAASLHHSNIVPVFSQGYDSGVHFFAMQYIDGQPLDQLIRRCQSVSEENGESQLATGSDLVDPGMRPSGGERSDEWPPMDSVLSTIVCEPSVETVAPDDSGQTWYQSQSYFRGVALLGEQVADALHYAHSHGVLHRDVKPGNLLLDSQGNIWLTDFGLAKDDLGLDLTESGAHVGTRRYMAPECFERPGDELSDVFGLGLTLYELLAWQSAFQDSPVPCARQVIPLSQLVPNVPRDLETIIHKSIEPDPQRRYASAGELAADLQRFSAGEPIRARRISWFERGGRWCRRNPALAALTGLVALLLVMLATGSIMAAVHFSQQAEEARGLVADRERAVRTRQAALASQEKAYRTSEESRLDAEHNAKRARAVTRFLVSDMISDLQPSRRRGKPLTVRSVLDRASRRVENAFVDQPETEASVRQALGRAYQALGLNREAEEQLSAAVCQATAALGKDHSETLITVSLLANSIGNRGRYREALPLHQQAVDGLSKIHSEDHHYPLAARHNLALCLLNLGRNQDALERFQEVRERRVHVLGPEHPETLKTDNNLASCLKGLGRRDEARRLHERTLEIRLRVLGEDHPETLGTMNNLAQLVSLSGEHRKAQELYERTLAVKRRTLGPEHPLTLNTMHNLATCLYRQGAYQQSLELNRQTLAIRRRVLDPDHPSLLKNQCNLGASLLKLGRSQEARPLLEETLLKQRTVRGHDHAETLVTHHRLALCLEALGRTDEAGRLLESLVSLQKKRLGDEHPQKLWVQRQLVGNLVRREKWTQALPIVADAVAHHRTRYGQDSHLLAKCLVLQARVLMNTQRLAVAVTTLRESLEIEARKPTTCCRMKDSVLLMLSNGLVRLKNYEEAERLLLQAYEEKQSKRSQPIVNGLLQLYEAWDRPERVKAWRSRLQDLTAATTASDPS